jgi:hypothetical protein
MMRTKHRKSNFDHYMRLFTVVVRLSFLQVVLACARTRLSRTHASSPLADARPQSSRLIGRAVLLPQPSS